MWIRLGWRSLFLILGRGTSRSLVSRNGRLGSADTSLRRVKMVLLESPTNPLLKIADIALISSTVKAASPSALIVVDNTMMSPYLQRPLEIGADIVYDSATKYLSGHHDLMAGVIAISNPDIAKNVAFLINSVGSGLAPFDSFLLLRGIKTISIRMDRMLSTAQLVAAYLDTLGFLVHYPGLKRHPKRDVHYRQATGAGAVLSFVTDDKALSERIVGGTRLWGISVSFGAVNSLISMPCLMSCVLPDCLWQADMALAMPLSPLQSERNAVFPRTSSAFALESKIPATSLMTSSTLSCLLAPSCQTTPTRPRRILARRCSSVQIGKPGFWTEPRGSNDPTVELWTGWLTG